MAAERRFDLLLIEGTGISEPMPVAATLHAEGSRGASLARWARIDAMVTVVDASRCEDWGVGLGGGGGRGCHCWRCDCYRTGLAHAARLPSSHLLYFIPPRRLAEDLASEDLLQDRQLQASGEWAGVWVGGWRGVK